MEYKTSPRITKEVIKEILNVKKEKGLTPESIVERATNVHSELHELFNWDDNSAAHQWRLQQARVLINEIRVIIEEKEFHAFENINITEEAGSNEYLERKEILDNEQFRQLMIKKAFSYLVYWKEQYKDYKEFNPIFKNIEKVRTKLGVKKK